MRRLPVYLLLDTSGSMMGEPIEAVKNGVQVLVSTLRQDPYALETAYLSIITFDNDAQQVVPLTELVSFQLPRISAKGLTSMGDALQCLAHAIEREVVKTTTQTKGDWKPLVFIMTDGRPTDDWRKGIAALKNTRTGIVVACAAGPEADLSILQQLTATTVSLDTADANTIRAFFKWVSASIATGSQKVENNAEVAGLSELPPPPPEVRVVLEKK